MEELRRTLGFWSCLAVGVGLVVASTTLVTLGQGMGIAGGAFIFSMIIAWFLQLFSAMSFGEMACMMPRAGSISTYTLAAMGPLPAIVATLAGYVVVTLLAGPAELAVTGAVVNGAFLPSVPPMVISLVVLAVLIGSNILGVDVFAKLQVVFTLIMIVSMSLLGVIGLMNLGNPAPPMPDAPMFAVESPLLVFQLVALAIWLYIGIEFVCPLAEETINPEKNIPMAMILGLGIIFVVNVLYGFASIKYIPLDRLAESAEPHVEVARAILGRPGEIWIAFVTLAATSSSVNTLVGVVPRMLYGMAHSGELPKVFGAVHPRFRTPWFGILLIGAAMAAIVLSGLTNIEFILILILAACCCWMLAYIIAHLDCMILRAKYKDLHRPYKTPFYPLPQVLGIIGFLASIILIFDDWETQMSIYRVAVITIAISVVYGVVWLKMKGRKLFEPISIEQALSE